MKPSYTSLVIPIQDAPFIQSFRKQHIFTPAASMPPHITIHSPFVSVEDIDKSILANLQDVISDHSQFEFTLDKIERFVDVGVLYLAPTPSNPFHALSQSIRTHFPAYPSLFETPIMHVTIARNDNSLELDEIEDKFREMYEAQLPHKTSATKVCLYEKWDGVWHLHSTYPLTE